jgi:hypothetical protein
LVTAKGRTVNYLSHNYDGYDCSYDHSIALILHNAIAFAYKRFVIKARALFIMFKNVTPRQN